MTDRRALATVVAAVIGTLAIAASPTPDGLTLAGKYALATTFFAGSMWVTGALPLAVTSLLVPVWLMAFGVYSTLEAALSGFADPVVFLFLGTFVLANALQNHGIDRRVALRLVVRLGTSPRRVVLGVMLTTALLSMVISNTATAAMMTPVALGLVHEIAGDGEYPTNVHTATLLGVAYAASVGGVATLIGTPPNAIVVAELSRTLDVQISFVEWMALGVPIAVVTLPIVWFVLIRVFPPQVADVSGARASAAAELERAGPLSPTARRVAAVFAATALLWVAGGLGFLFAPYLPAPVFVTLFGGTGASVFGTVGHQGLLYFAAVALLAIPVLFLVGGVDGEDVFDVDWATLVLFGGGLSLADALVDTQATEWLATVVFDPVVGAPLVVLVATVVLFTVAVGEFASNTASVAILAPILVEFGRVAGPGLGLSAVEAGVLLAVAAAVASSFGFALPVATPPNAIVYGTRQVTRQQMLRAGVVLDLLMVPVTTTLLVVLLGTLLTTVFA